MPRILIAEESAVTGEMMEIRLTGVGHEVIRSRNGREALERVAKDRPDLILLDMMMPELDGLEFLQQVKQDALLGSIPVLVVSARSREEDILSALAAGASDYVTKPFSLRELVARIDRVLSQGPEPLRILVQGELAGVAVGEVVQADARGASVRFPCDGAPKLAIGDPAKLSLSSPFLADQIEVPALVASRGEAEPMRTYGFGFPERGGPAPEMIRAFLDLIGRRGAYRVSLEGPETVDVLVLAQALGESREFPGRLLDLSTGGARLLLKADAERYLHHVDGFEIRFCLPGSDDVLTLDVAVRHRVRCEEGVTYGIRFDPDRSPDFLEQQEQISEFVGLRTG